MDEEDVQCNNRLPCEKIRRGNVLYCGNGETWVKKGGEKSMEKELFLLSGCRPVFLVTLGR